LRHDIDFIARMRILESRRGVWLSEGDAQAAGQSAGPVGSGLAMEERKG
jgi:hypothetical protein